MQAGLLRYLIVAVLFFAAAAYIKDDCIKEKSDDLFGCEFCDPDINGVKSEKRVYDSTSQKCKTLTIQKVYHELDLTSNRNKEKYFVISIENEEVERLKAPLFSSDIKVLSVRLNVKKLASIPVNLFENQKDNLRIVDLITPLISKYPPVALHSLSKMSELILFSTADLTFNSFDSLRSKNVLQSVAFLTEESETFQSGALKSLKNLKSFVLYAKNVNGLSADLFPSTLTDLKEIRMDNMPFTAFPSGLVKEILTRAPSLKKIALTMNSMKTVKNADWSMLINSKLEFVDVSDNPLDCSCDMIPVTKQNNFVQIDGTCRTPQKFAGVELSKLTQADFQHCPKA